MQNIDIMNNSIMNRLRTIEMEIGIEFINSVTNAVIW